MWSAYYVITILHHSTQMEIRTYPYFAIASHPGSNYAWVQG